MTRLWVRTPTIPSAPMSARLGRPVWLKLENTQPVGSFKQRGMGLSCARAVARGAEQLITSSGGNAGYAVAWAGRRLGVPVTVVVPSRTSPAMRERIEAEGAVVMVHGEVWDDAHAHAQTLPGALIHPFDHPDCWEGHATLVREIAEDGVQPSVVVVAVGGGGLLTGVALGMADVGWSSVPIVAVETHGTASLRAAVDAGELVTLPAIDSVALTLGARTVCRGALDVAQTRPLSSHTVSDEAALAAAARFDREHRMRVEPACGAALAAVERGDLPGDGPVVVVVCGGAAA